MGGHGGLNILPQKRWNVYNFENREKVRLDEEAAAKEEQLKQEQSRKRDAEFRLERLREARSLHASRPDSPPRNSTDSNHINLFEGLKTFPAFDRAGHESEDGPNPKKKQKREKRDGDSAPPKVILPEDEKYRLGYGLVGKGVKMPWYLSRQVDDDGESAAAASGSGRAESSEKSSGKKTLEELREERMKREKREKERERALLSGKKGYSRDRFSARLR